MEYMLGGYMVRLARAEEMQVIYRLRYQIFCKELGFIDPESYPDGREVDAYDLESAHMVILRDDRIVAYARFIQPSMHKKFLMEETAALPSVFDREKTVEVSRGFIIPEERKRGLKDVLLDAVCAYCVLHGFTYLLSFSNTIMYENWKKRGVDFVFVGDPVSHHGYESWPLIIRMANQ